MSHESVRQQASSNASDPKLSSTGSGSPFWTLPAFLVIGGGLLLTVGVYVAGEPGEPRSPLAPLAFGAPTLVAGLLALFGILRGHPAMVLAAGIALLPLSFISVVLWPMFLPAALLIAYGAGRTRGTSLGEVAAAVVVAVGLPVALFAMLVHQDPAMWISDDGKRGGGSSDIVTNAEVAVSLAITAAVASAGIVSIRRRC